MKKSLYIRICTKALNLLVILMPYFACATSTAVPLMHNADFSITVPADRAENSSWSPDKFNRQDARIHNPFLSSFVGNSYFAFIYLAERNSPPYFVLRNQLAAPPTINCPGNLISNTDPGVCKALLSGLAATINDPDGNISTLTWKMTGATAANSPFFGINNILTIYNFNKGITTITYTVTDSTNLSALCSFSVTVNDIEKPSLTCPTDENIIIPSCAMQTEPVTFNLLSASDNCGISTFFSDAPSRFPLGNTIVTWTVTDNSGNANQCMLNVTVTNDPPITGSIVSQTNVACMGSTTGSVTVAGSGGTYPYQFSINGGAFQASGTFNNLGAGVYNITIKDANNCQTNVPVTIIQSATLLTASITGQTNVLCAGQANGNATVLAGGGTSPYTYSWNTVPVQTAATAINLTARAYTVTVKDTAGCVKTASVTITQPTPIVIIITKTNIACAGIPDGTATAKASGGTPPYSYAWLTTPIQTTETVSNLPAGTYTVAVFDSLGCFKPAFVTITEPASVFTASITGHTDVLCAGSNTGSLTVSGLGGTPPYLYNINGGAFQASGIFNSLSAGVYTIVAHDANNCEVILTETIKEPASALTASITGQTNVLCAGQANGSATVAASGGTAPYTFSWNSVPVQTAATAINLTARSYIVTVTDASGCIKTVNVTITQPVPITIAITKSNVACFGESTGTATATVSGGTPPYTYAWLTTPIQTTPTVTNLPAGTYTVAIFDSLGCFKPAFVTITEPAAPLTVSITNQINIICASDNTGSLTVTGNGGASPYQYNIGGGTYQASGTFSGLTAGTYTITARDANNCEFSTTGTITAPANALSAVISQTNVLCAGQANGTATVTASGGTLPYTYSWNTTPVKTTATVSNLTARSYTVITTDASGCSIPLTITITQPNALSVSLNKTDVACTGDATGTATALVTGGTPPYTYAWLTTPIQTTATVTNLPAGTYTLAIFDSLGCFKPAFVTIAEPPVKLTASITNQVDVPCASSNTGSVTVEGSDGVAPYEYNLNGGLYQSGGTFTDLVTGTYTINVRDANGCIFIISATIISPANGISASITSQTNVLCKGQSDGVATVTASGGTLPYTYSWNTVPAVITATISNLPAGSYSVTTTDKNGCFVTNTAIITEPDTELSASITSQVNFDCFTGTKGSVTVAAVGGTPVYQFSLDRGLYQGNGIFTGIDPGSHIVSIQDANNCEFSLPVEITITGLVAAVNDTVSTNEDIQLLGQVMSNDLVQCNLPIVVASNSDPLHGTAVVNSDGTFVYTPSLNYNGSDFFTYTLVDNIGGLSTGTVVIRIDPVNDSPVVVNETISVYYNLPKPGNILPGGNYDPDSTALTVNTTPVADAAHGTFIIAADGSYTYTPDLNYIGTDMVVISICDAGIPLPPACTNDTIFITVLPPNKPPLTVKENIVVCNNATFTGTLTNGGTVFNGDSDPENNLPISVGSVPVQGPMHGTFSFTDIATGTFDYTPNNSYAGPDYVIVSMCDSGIPVECSNDTIFIQVLGLVVADAGSGQMLCNSDVAILVGNSPSAGIGNWSFVSGPNTPTVFPATGNVANASGLIASTVPYVFSYSIQNGSCFSTDTMSVINYLPATPSFAGTDQKFCKNSVNISATLAATIPITGTGTWTQLSGPTVATFNDSSDPKTDVSNLVTGEYEFQWLITNGICQSNADVVAITVSESVTVNAGTDQLILPGTSTLLSGSASGGSGFYSRSWQPAGLLINPAVDNPSTVELSLPTAFTYTVLDILTGCSDSDTVEITIDTKPISIVGVDDYDTTLINSSATIHVLANDLNPLNIPVTISFCGFPSHGFVVLNSDNSITYTPYMDYEGEDEFCYKICDKVHPTLCVDATVHINVKKPSLDDLFAYNGISPNSDGNNDIWKIRGIEKYPDNTVIIFNRWGDKLREFAGYNNTTVSWDGNNENGKPVPNGTYFYILDVKNVGVLKGWIYIRGGK